MGFARYYRRFIKNFSQITAPLYSLTGNLNFIWTDKCDTSFTDLKWLVWTSPVLQVPNWDIHFQISSDASYIAIGVVLGQEEDKKPYAIYYISKNLTPVVLNYTITEKEFLAVIYAINKFRHYVTRYLLFLYTNHSTIKYLANKPITSGRVTRWLLLLQEFDITIRDQLGKENLVSDILSRVPRTYDTVVVDD